MSCFELPSIVATPNALAGHIAGIAAARRSVGEEFKLFAQNIFGIRLDDVREQLVVIGVNKSKEAADGAKDDRATIAVSAST